MSIMKGYIRTENNEKYVQKITRTVDLDEFKTLKNESTNGAFDEQMPTGQIGEIVLRNYFLNKGLTVYNTNKSSKCFVDRKMVDCKEGDLMTVDAAGKRTTYEIKTPSASNESNCVFFNVMDLWRHFTDFSYSEEKELPKIYEEGWLWGNTSDYLVLIIGIGSYKWNKDTDKAEETHAPSDKVMMIKIKNDFGHRHVLKDFFRIQLMKKYGWQYDFETPNEDNYNEIKKFTTRAGYVSDFVLTLPTEGRNGYSRDKKSRKPEEQYYYNTPYIHDDIAIKANIDWLVSELQKYSGDENITVSTFDYNDTLVFGEGDE